MKKNYTITLIMLTLITVRSLAQPTFTSADLPAAGTSLTMHDVDTTGVTEGASGAGQTWDFSPYPATGNSNTIMVVDPATTPFTDTFPTATLALQAGTAGAYSFTYLLTNTSFVDLIGQGTQTTIGDVIHTYSDVRRMIDFPFTYNSSLTDSYSAYASNALGDQYRYGTVTTMGDAWGTIITPAGTYSNTLRLIQMEYNVDSTVTPLGTLVTQTHSTSFNWSMSNAFEALYSISYDTIMSSLGGTTITKSVNYGTVATAINNLSSDASPLEVYPNPAVNTNIINIQAVGLQAGATKFIATDIQGCEVKSLLFELKPANHKFVSVDLGALPAGFYFIRLEQKNINYATKFVKQ